MRINMCISITDVKKDNADAVLTQQEVEIINAIRSLCVCRLTMNLPFSEQCLSFSFLLAFSFSYLPSNGSLLVFIACFFSQL